jgi:hypothetical protein
MKSPQKKPGDTCTRQFLGRDWLKKKGGARKWKEHSEEMAIVVMSVGRIGKGRQCGRLVFTTGEMFSESTWSNVVGRQTTQCGVGNCSGMAWRYRRHFLSKLEES